MRHLALIQSNDKILGGATLNIMDKLIYFAPRIMGILAIAFISIFALDAFEPGKPLADSLLDFSIHLIPSALLAIAIAIAWRFERFGGVMFIAVGLVPFVPWRGLELQYVLVGGPFLTTGALFLLSYWWRTRRKT